MTVSVEFSRMLGVTDTFQSRAHIRELGSKNGSRRCLPVRLGKWSPQEQQLTGGKDARSRQSPTQSGFAAGYLETEKLSEVLLQLNETSLSQLRRDHETGHLGHKIVQAAK
jgi:hypothetical protein